MTILKRTLSDLDAQASGTVVLWEQLDTLSQDGWLSTASSFWELVANVEAHLAMTFHRYIEAGRLELFVNGRTVAPWNPFMAGNPFRRESPREVVWDAKGERCVTFTGYTMPHRKHLTKEEYDAAAGPLGWVPGQGFYVYRSDRLIAGGGWLGLGRTGRPWKPEQMYRLARINLDITNASDLDWNLDLRKSTAVPPAVFRHRLKQLADVMRRWSRNVDQSEARARRGTTDQESTVWIVGEAGKAHRINRRHPAVARALAAAGAGAVEIRTLLSLIDATAPMQPLEAAPVTTVPAPMATDEGDDERLVANIYAALKRGTGMSPAAARERLVELPQFRGKQDLVERALAKIESKH